MHFVGLFFFLSSLLKMQGLKNKTVVTVCGYLNFFYITLFGDGHTVVFVKAEQPSNQTRKSET